jgi:uracil DNA glycosylase
MKTHMSLPQVSMRTSGSAGIAPRAPSTGTVRAWARRGILVLTLVLCSLGAAAWASPGHGSTGHVQASAHQPANNLALLAEGDSISSGQTNRLPWMY